MVSGAGWTQETASTETLMLLQTVSRAGSQAKKTNTEVLAHFFFFG